MEYRADWLSYQKKLRINAAPPGLMDLLTRHAAEPTIKKQVAGSCS